VNLKVSNGEVSALDPANQNSNCQARQQAGDQDRGARELHLRRLASIFFSHRKNSVLTVAATASTNTISGYITALSKLL
jgi:hypothetical protein